MVFKNRQVTLGHFVDTGCSPQKTWCQQEHRCSVTEQQIESVNTGISRRHLFMICILCQVEPSRRTKRCGELSSPLQQTLAARHELQCREFPGIREEGKFREDGGGEQYRETGDWCSSIRFTASWTTKSSSSTSKDPSGANKIQQPKLTPIDGAFS